MSQHLFYALVQGLVNLVFFLYLVRPRCALSFANGCCVCLLVAFYHSEYTPMQLPSVATYQRDVQRFAALFPARQTVRVLGRGEPRLRARRVRKPDRGRGGALLPGAVARVQGLHGHRAGRARRGKNRTDTLTDLHLRIQARDPSPGDGHADDLGPAQLRGRQPPGKLAHARSGEGIRRPGVADGDGRDREIRRRLPQPRRRGPDAGGAGAEVHVRACRRGAADQAHVHLQHRSTFSSAMW